MNILFFLTPKDEIAFIHEDATLRQTLEKMEYHRYSAVPVISGDGYYVGTITEGDLLWGIKNQYDLSLKEAEKIPISNIARHADNQPVKVSTSIDELVAKAMEQNFVPVIDDRGIFIGIITRKKLIHYFYERQHGDQTAEFCSKQELASGI